ADFSELSAQSLTDLRFAPVGSERMSTGHPEPPLPSVGGSNEKKSLIENAGMLLNDEELEMVAGGKAHVMYVSSGELTHVPEWWDIQKNVCIICKTHCRHQHFSYFPKGPDFEGYYCENGHKLVVD
ncbi:MAG: hypothetical protein K5985_07710, partial [Lachnospiraceae bacterium]|nr:hypothetical protein [Lachnospiraceae bacterium]